MHSEPLQTDESIAHPVRALQGFAAAVDRYKFKLEQCPTFDIVTRAIELQHHFNHTSFTPLLNQKNKGSLPCLHLHGYIFKQNWEN